MVDLLKFESALILMRKGNIISRKSDPRFRMRLTRGGGIEIEDPTIIGKWWCDQELSSKLILAEDFMVDISCCQAL